MKISEITSIGWLNDLDGVQLVACTKVNSFGFRTIVSREEFEAARGDANDLKELFVDSWERKRNNVASTVKVSRRGVNR